MRAVVVGIDVVIGRQPELYFPLSQHDQNLVPQVIVAIIVGDIAHADDLVEDTNKGR